MCHHVWLQEHDAQGKHKGLMSYNTNHGTRALKKHVHFEHLDLYNKWGVFLLQRLVETKNDKQSTKEWKNVFF